MCLSDSASVSINAEGIRRRRPLSSLIWFYLTTVTLPPFQRTVKNIGKVGIGTYPHYRTCSRIVLQGWGARQWKSVKSKIMVIRQDNWEKIFFPERNGKIRTPHVYAKEDFFLGGETWTRVSRLENGNLFRCTGCVEVRMIGSERSADEDLINVDRHIIAIAI